jgi:hypothetical protein
LDSKPTKSVGHFEEDKFSVGGRQFLLECCPKLIKTANFGQSAVNKSQSKNKNEQYCAIMLFIFKVAETFCQFSIQDCHYFSPCLCLTLSLSTSNDIISESLNINSELMFI